MLRAAAAALAGLAEKAHPWADRADDGQAGIDPAWATHLFAGGHSEVEC